MKQPIPSLLLGGLLAWVGVGLAALAPAQIDQRYGKSFVVSPVGTFDTDAMNPKVSNRKVERHRKVPPNPFVRIALGTTIFNDLLVGEPENYERVDSVKRFPGISMTASYPPDPDLAVGPSHIVQVVNSSIGIFDFKGKKLFQQDSSDMFNGTGATQFQFDPKVIYDSESQRFFLLFLEQSDNQLLSKLLIAVSDDSNPNGKWLLYRLESKALIRGNLFWLDYPGFACSSDYVAVCGSMFSFDQTDTAGTQFIVMDKAALLAGNAVTVTPIFAEDAGTVKLGLNPEPSKSIYGATLDTSSSVRLFAIQKNSSGKPALSSTKVTVPNYSVAPANAFGPGGASLDTLNDRPINAAYRQDRLAIAHAISNPNDTSLSAVRWYDFKMNAWPAGSALPTLTQSGNIPGGNALHTLIPAVNYNRVGDLALIFNRVGPSRNPEVVVTGRKANDPLGSVGLQTVVATSGSAPNRSMAGRWGDYSGLVVDPVDGFTLWGTAETIDSGGSWTTEITSWKISAPQVGLPPLVPNGVASWKDPSSNTVLGTIQGGTANLRASDGGSVLVRSVPISGLGQVSAIDMRFDTSLRSGSVFGLSAKIRSTGPAKSSQTVFMLNWKTRKYDSVGTAAVNGKVQTLKLSVDPSPYIYSTSFQTAPGTRDGTLRVALRCVLPLANGAMPSPYTFAVDQFNLIAE